MTVDITRTSSHSMRSGPRLRIRYSHEFERSRVEYTLSKLSWYRENGYTITLPNDMKIADVTEPQSLHDSMLSDVEREYTNDFFQKIAESINEQWDWFIDHWPTESIQETTLTFLDEYELYLTKYGTRGSYDSPNTIITNVHLRKLENTASVIFHEMIHLSIESLVLKYQTPHWYKERAVDLLYKKLLPEKAFEQNLPKEALQVDPIFNRDYGDIEMIIKNISTLPT